MKVVRALAIAVLLTACASEASPGTPGSLTARLNGQADFFAGASTYSK